MHVSVFGSSLKGRVIIAKHMMTKTLQYWDTPVQKIQRIECRIQNTLQRSLKLSKRITGSPDYILSLPLIPDQFIRAGNSEMDQQPKHTVDITEAWCKRLTELRRADDSDALTALFKRRLQEGAEGIALLEEDIPVAYTWTAVGMTLPEDGDKTRFSLDRSQVYIYDTFIDPDKRGQQLFPQLMYAVQQKYLKREKHQFIVLIDLMNTPSLRAHMKIGGSVVGTISYRFRRRKMERIIRTEKHAFSVSSAADEIEPAVCDLSHLADET